MTKGMPQIQHIKIHHRSHKSESTTNKSHKNSKANNSLRFQNLLQGTFLIQSRSYPSLINIKPLTSFLLLWKMNLETQHQSVWRKASTGMRSTSVCYCMQRDVFVPVIMILADRVILRRVLLNLSTNPFQEEWYGIVLVFARLINSASCFIKSPSKFRPSSIWSFRGTKK